MKKRLNVTFNDDKAGDNYFDDNNCECLCQTCEVNRKNGWSRANENGKAAATITAVEKSGSSTPQDRDCHLETEFMKSRHSTEPGDLKFSQHEVVSPHNSRFPTAGESFFPQNNQCHVKRKQTNSGSAGISKKLKCEIPSHSTPIRDELSPTHSSTSTAHSDISSTGEIRSSTDATSVGEETTPVQASNYDSTELRSLETRCISDASNQLHKLGHCLENLPSQKYNPVPKLLKSPKRPWPSRTRRKFKQKDLYPDFKARDHLKAEVHSSYSISDRYHIPTMRIPGDYDRPLRLLVGLASSWIECQNCQDYFLQVNAYTPRFCCPRCERHSKLYGYIWPKTEKKNFDDEEERVLDHRTINRFVHPADYKMVKKHNRMRTMNEAEITCASELVSSNPESLESGSTTTRSLRY